MSRSFNGLFPSLAHQLLALGARLRDARLRRTLTSVRFAERVGVSRDTLHRMERGDPNIAIGTYAKALRVLGLDADIDLLAKEDAVGRALQDQALAPRRVSKARGRVAREEAEVSGFDGLSSNGAVGLTTGFDEAAASPTEDLRERNQKALARLLKGDSSGKVDGSA